MRKYVMILMMVLGMVAPSWAKSDAPTLGSENAVTTGVVNLRVGPSKSSDSLGKIHANEPVTVVGTEGDWSKVKVVTASGNTVEGYIISSSLKPIERAVAKMVFEKKSDSYKAPGRNRIWLYIFLSISGLLLLVCVFEIVTRRSEPANGLINSFKYGSILDAGTGMGITVLFSLGVLLFFYYCTWDERKVSVETAVVKQSEMELPGLTECFKSLTKGKTPTMTVRVGDSIRILGVEKRRSGSYYWAELKGTGSRGRIPASALRLSDDEQTLLNKDLMLSPHPYRVMSLKRFENEIMGRTLAEGDPLDTRITDRATDGKTTYCSYALHVLDPASGRIFRPTVHYNAEQVAFTYDRALLGSHYNAWLLKWLPLASWFYDQDWMNWIVSEGRYWRFHFSIDWQLSGFWGGLLRIVLLLLFLALALAWIASLCLVPIFVLTLLARLHYIYYPLSNSALVWMVSIVGVVLGYGIVLLCLSEYSWIYYLPVTFMAFMAGIVHVSVHLEENRCDACKLMYSISFDHEELDREYDTDWYHRSEQGELLRRIVNKWDTWDDVTTTTKNGYGEVVGRSTRRENLRHHTRTTDTHLYHDYRCKDHVKEYTRYYRCDECGNITTKPREERKMIAKELVGTHTETHTHET